MKFIPEATVVLPSYYQIHRDIALLKTLSLEPIIRLCSNESPLGPNPAILKTLSHAGRDLHCYPDPESTALKKQIAKQHGIDSAHVLIGHGSSELLELITRYRITTQHTAVIPAYSYPLYEHLVTQNGGQSIIVNTLGWDYDLHALRRAILPNTTLIFLGHPNNPTGTFLNWERLCHFIREIPSTIHLVIDEAYYDFVESTPHYRTAISLITQYPQVIVMRTFSKAYGLAGLRVGYAIAAPQIIEQMTRFKQFANVNTLAQRAALLAITDQHYRTIVLNTVEKNRVYFMAILDALEIVYVPTKTNFLLIKVPGNANDFYKKLCQHRIIVQPLTAYGLPTYIRVSIGTEEQINAFCIAMKKVLSL